MKTFVSLEAVDTSPLVYLMRPRPPMSCNMIILIVIMTYYGRPHVRHVCAQPNRSLKSNRMSGKFVT